MSVQFGLQRETRPVGKNRIPATERRLVKKCDNSKNHLLHVFRAATPAAGLLFSHSQCLFHLCPEGFSVRNRLPVIAQPHDGGKHFLESERKIPAAPVES